MGRALLILTDDASRAKAKHWIDKAPKWTRVEFKATQRSLDQNKLMHVMVTEVADQGTYHGQKLSVNDWKLVFVQAAELESNPVPSIDGKSLVALGRHTSDLSVEQMSNLIEFIFMWGAENGVVFNEPEPG